MPVCEGCGGSFDDSFKFCPNCGRAKPEPRKVTLAVEVSEKKHDFDCPLCEDARSVQKVSAIVRKDTGIRQGTTTTSGSAQIYAESSGAHIGNQYSSSVSSSYEKSQSILAKKLSLPDEPVEPKSSSFEVNDTWGMVGGVGCYILGIIVTWPLGRMINSDAFWSGAIVFFCLAPILAGVGGFLFLLFVNSLNDSDGKYQAALEEFKKDHADYDKLKAQWDELYYCHKHDIVFTLSRREPAPLDEAIQACARWAAKN